MAQRILGYGYLPEAGFIKLSETVLLKGPVVQSQGGSTLTVWQGLASAERTRLWIRFAGQPWPLEGALLDLGDGQELRATSWAWLPDGQRPTGAVVSFAAMPPGIAQTTFSLPEGWAIPVEWIPAQQASLAPTEVTVPYPKHTPTGPANLVPCIAAQDTVRLCVKAAFVDAEGTHLLLEGEAIEPGTRLTWDAAIAHQTLELVDERKRVYPLDKAVAVGERPGTGQASLSLRFPSLTDDVQVVALRLSELTVWLHRGVGAAGTSVSVTIPGPLELAFRLPERRPSHRRPWSCAVARPSLPRPQLLPYREGPDQARCKERSHHDHYDGRAARRVRQTGAHPARLAERLALAGILLLSTFLNLYRLHTVGINGIGNYYYAAAVQTMLTSWHHFFYLCVDPAGFVSLDKPPLAYWIQAASARVFGFRGLSLLMPQVIAGVVSVYVLYRLVRRSHGEWPALFAALALAVTSISVVTNRSNTAESLLVLVLLLASWAVLRAVEQGSRRWLLLAAALVGVGFNLKMLQLLLVAPALVALYLVASPWPWRRRLLNAGWAVLVALLVAMPWMLAVELTPPGQHPYMGGSRNNSVLDLIIGYNGLARLWGENWAFYLGVPGPLRLFNDKLGGQASWLLPLILVGLPAALWQLGRQPKPGAQRSRRRNALILWSAWLVFQAVYFSISTFYHTYYLSLCAPAIAALAGISAEALWTAWRTGGWARALTVSALAGAPG